MLKLLLYRVLPLLLRPAAIMLEQALVVDGYLLVVILPVSMMALTLSSVPVHLEYFKALPAESSQSERGRDYASALTWTALFGVTILYLTLVAPPSGFSSLLAACACMMFLVEKLSDEASRALEFRKMFARWFLVQLLRSIWVFVPIFAAVGGANYEWSFAISAAFSVAAMYIVFGRVSGLHPVIDRRGLALVRSKLIYFAGGVLPASYRQLPRIAVAKYFPEQAHLFLALAQLSQGIGLLFSVRYQVPYRRIIARRPRMFQKILEPAMIRVLVPCGVVASLLAIPSIASSIGVAKSELYTAAWLLVAVTADALVFAVLAAHLGYIQWFASRAAAGEFYVYSVAMAVLIIVGLYFLGYMSEIGILSIPSMSMAVGFVWLLFMKVRFFSNPKKHE